MDSVTTMMRRAVRLPLDKLVRRLPRGLLVHALPQGAPPVGLSTTKAVEPPNSRRIAQRLADAYGAAKADERHSRISSPENDLWTGLLNREFRELVGILESRDLSSLTRYLQNLGHEFTWFGGVTLSIDGFTSTRGAHEVALSYLDKLVCLAEALGALPLENPEQPSSRLNMYMDVDEICMRIEQRIGFPIVPHAAALPVTGLTSRSGPLHYRYFNSLYAAVRISEILSGKGPVCEYGGGLGLVAYYANALGHTDYSIFDLPLVNVVAGYFLLNALGEDAVCLFGEDHVHPAVKVLPYWRCVNADPGSFMLSVNQDSFPEIDPVLVVQYLAQIKRTTTRYFLSINQEAQASMGSRNQNSVPALVAEHGGFSRVYRMKYWIREGYAEELYAIDRAS